MAQTPHIGIRTGVDASVGERIKRLRELKGLSQAALAEMVGTSQQTIDRIERAETIRSSFVPEILAALGVARDGRPPTAEELAADLNAKVLADVLGKVDQVNQELGPAPTYVAPNEMPVQLLEELRGFIMTDEPIQTIARPAPLLKVKGAYAFIANTNLMLPALKRGELALVHPHLPPRLGDDVVLRQAGSPNRVQLGTLLSDPGVDGDWHVAQWGQPEGAREMQFSREAFPRAHVIFGKFRQPN
jgi:transcriptional regulator with XRE-family HTH domain